ncbi:hypothetical protein NLU13_9195 [Sarocladium strictum]|uniref:C2H2-type domain-containing protein n=1 Tax=Sarocladium strictum TaxID=5046 RepID=A0AA39L3Y7_SARSR|nr:hypothetical protein NLU13_9195 [Sarocladium strictum]
MHARDATGRKVSLLNDDSTGAKQSRPVPYARPMSFSAASHVLSQPYPTSRSNSSSPNTPELMRSDSYDSHLSTDAISPLTPSLDFSYTRTSLYPLGGDSVTSPLPERPGKRYPCRYRETHGCEKTFTTSGHASRHSKIHTAEKAVQCTFPGCQKKFTRADNMKQHLETHYKDKSRSSSQRAHKAAALAEARRSSTARSRSSVPNDSTQWEPTEQYALPTPPLASPNGTTGAWDMRAMNLPLLNRPVAARTPSSGLDALAMAVACQEGGR